MIKTYNPKETKKWLEYSTVDLNKLVNYIKSENPDLIK